jgi:hypothetical protein
MTPPPRAPWLLPLALALLAAPARPYYPPGEDVLARPKVHGTLVLQAIEVLRGDGHEEAANFFERYRRSLVQGTRDADRGQGALDLDTLMAALDRKAEGRFAKGLRRRAWAKLRPEILERARPVLQRSIPRASFTHFHDPERDQGFRMDLGRRADLDLDQVLTWLDELALLPWELSTLLGPHASARDVADLSYARALDAMRSAPVDIAYQSGPFDGDLAPHVEEAVRWLGESLHMVADGTVPHHSNNDGSQHPESNHGQWEGRCERWIVEPGFPHASSGAIGESDLSAAGQAPFGGAGAYVVHAARASRSWIDAARGDEAAQRRASEVLLPLAERLSAGLMLRFFQSWEEDAHRVVSFRVREVAKRGVGDLVGREDYRARLTLAGMRRETGVLPGGDVIRPQAILPDAWLLCARVPDSGAIPVHVEILERDLTRERAVDLHPSVTTRGGVDLVVDPEAGEVRVPGQPARPLAGPVELRLEGDAWTPPAARVTLELEVLPRRAGAPASFEVPAPTSFWEDLFTN